MKSLASTLFAVLLATAAVHAADSPIDKLPENTIVTVRFDSASAFFKAWEKLAVNLGKPADQVPLKALIGGALHNPLYTGIDLNRPAALALVIPMRAPLAHEIQPGPDDWDEPADPAMGDPFMNARAQDRPAEEELRPGEPELCLVLPLSDPDMFAEAMAEQEAPFATKIDGDHVIVGQPDWLESTGKYSLPGAFAHKAPIAVKVDLGQFARIFKEAFEEMRKTFTEVDEFTGDDEVLAGPFVRLFLQVMNEGRSADIGLNVTDKGCDLAYSLAAREGTALARAIAEAGKVAPAHVNRLMPGSHLVAMRTAFFHNYVRHMPEQIRQLDEIDMDDEEDRTMVTAFDSFTALMKASESLVVSVDLNPDTGAIDATAILGGKGDDLRTRVAALARAIAAVNEDEGMTFEADTQTIAGAPVDRLEIVFNDNNDAEAEQVLKTMFDNPRGMDLLMAPRAEGLYIALGPNRKKHLGTMLRGEKFQDAWPETVQSIARDGGAGLAATDNRRELAWMRSLASQTGAPEEFLTMYDTVLKDIPHTPVNRLRVHVKDGRLTAEHHLPYEVIKLQMLQVTRMMGGMFMAFGAM
jgi:hypothetical protein